jgi:DNA-binding HxlR family transcriptional regulator
MFLAWRCPKEAAQSCYRMIYRHLTQVRILRYGTNVLISIKIKVLKPTSKYNCPVEATLDVIGGKWKVLILFWLQDQVWRFGELRRRIPHISERMLTQQLRELEENGIVHRKVHPVVPPRVEYSLTPYGRTLRPITDLMCEWGKKHLRRR